MKVSAKRIKEIIARTYTRELKSNGDGTWFARVLEFPGCMTEGDTVADAHENLDDAMACWVRGVLEDGYEVPAPFTEREYSGKFVVRLPKSLHRELAARAEREGVSLNQWVLSKLGT